MFYDLCCINGKETIYRTRLLKKQRGFFLFQPRLYVNFLIWSLNLMLINLLLCFSWTTFIQNNIICETSCSQINFPFFFMFCLECSQRFLNLLENFRLVLLMKDLLIKKRVRERTLSMQEGGRSVLQIFRKIFRSPGDHRPKYFMTQ